MREKENNYKKRRARESLGQRVRGRRKTFLIVLASVNHSTTWNGEKSGRKKNCPLHFTSKRVKVNFIYFIKGTKKRRNKITKKLHFCGQGWGSRHCANTASLA